MCVGGEGVAILIKTLNKQKENQFLKKAGYGYVKLCQKKRKKKWGGGLSVPMPMRCKHIWNFFFKLYFGNNNFGCDVLTIGSICIDF